MAESPASHPEASREKDDTKLREEYRSLVSKSRLPAKDKKVCLEWLDGDPGGHDAAQLEMRMKHFRSAEEAAEKQLAAYQTQVKEKVKEGEIRGETEAERVEWFMNNLSFAERAKILEKKDPKLDDLFDPKRQAVLKAFKTVFKYFSDLPAGAQEDLRRKFLGQELKEREEMVADLKAKKEILQSGILPTIVRSNLKKLSLESDAAQCKQMTADALKKHGEQKARFLKLPGPVQEEQKKEFTRLLLPEREVFLKNVEQKMARYSADYRGKIRTMQQPNKDGLTLFASAPESAPGSSADRYMKWFTQKLSLKGMEEKLGNSDLENPERKTLCAEMGAALKSFAPKDKAGAIESFNKAHLQARRGIVARYHKTHGSAETPDKRNWIQRMIRKKAVSNEHQQVKQTVEAYAIGQEIAKRRERYQIVHHDRENLNQKAAEKGKTDTLKRTDALDRAVHSEHLRDHEGGLKIKMDTIETYNAERSEVKRVLKRDVDNQNAQLAGDLTLRTRTGEEVRDAHEYQRGELQRELTRVREAISPLLVQQASAEGIGATEKDIKEELQKTDWKVLAKEVIRKAA